MTSFTAPAGIGRRQFLQAGAMSVGAFALPEALRARTAAGRHAPARQAIVILLQGGCSHLETWDLKPDAPAEYRGEFAPISTNLPGLQISEHLPHLATRANHYNVLRSVYHGTPSHEAAIHWVLTGYDYPGANTSTKNRNIKPAMGAIAAKVLGPSQPGLPPYVCIPDGGQLGDRVRYASASFLGVANDPFETGTPPADSRTPFVLPPNLTLSKDVDLRRFDHRLALLRQLDQLPRALDASGVMSGIDEFNGQAFELLSHDATRNAFDLSQESQQTRARYGESRVGQEALLARRLAEAGVPFTLVNFSTNQEWDTHANNFKTLKNVQLPRMDLAVAALLDDLSERGLLETTLVALITEFGRTPRINATAGRDHWSDVFSIMLAGGGLKSGQVIGTSTANGERPQDRPVHFNEIASTIYHQLGISTDRMLQDGSGRPVAILDQGVPLPELV